MAKLIVYLNHYKIMIALAEFCFTGLLGVTCSFLQHVSVTDEAAGWEYFLRKQIKACFSARFQSKNIITSQYSENRDLP